VMMALFLGCLEYVLEDGQRWDWLEDPDIRLAAIVSGTSGLLFLWRSLTYAHPVVDLRALKNMNFALGCFFSFVTGIGIFATIYLTPVFLGRVRGFSALEIGEAVFSTGIFQVCAIPVYTTLARKGVDLRWLMMAGLAGFAASMFNFMPITHDWGWKELLLPQAFRGFSQQFAVAPIVTLTLGSLAPERLKQASGLFNLMRNLGGAIGIAMCGTLLNNRTNLHFLHLAEHLNSANPEVPAGALAGKVQSLKLLWSLTMREALTQSFADTFYVILLCFVVVTLMVPLLKKAGAPMKPSADAH